MRFAAVDFETATPVRDSACALGLCVVEDDAIVEHRVWLIRPPDNRYLPFFTQLHGIGPKDTEDAPEFADVLSEVLQLTEDLPLVAHNASFDMSVLRKGCERSGLTYPCADYYCTLVMSRALWTDMPGYSLPLVLAAKCGMKHAHHDAMEDAVAAARVLLQIGTEVGERDLGRVARRLQVSPGRLMGTDYAPCSGPRSMHHAEKYSVSEMEVNAEADQGHPFYDADVAFTGTLLSMTRQAAMQLVADRGGRPRTTVSRLTEYLVVGGIEYKSLVTGEPSSKLRTAIALKEKGCPVVILCEQEFLEYL